MGGRRRQHRGRTGFFLPVGRRRGAGAGLLVLRGNDDAAHGAGITQAAPSDPAGWRREGRGRRGFSGEVQTGSGVADHGLPAGGEGSVGEDGVELSDVTGADHGGTAELGAVAGEKDAP